MRIRRFSLLPPVVLVVAALLGACDTSGLPPATAVNIEDTVSLYALDGTPLSQPSGYNIQQRLVLRTDRSALFDLAFNITPAGQAVLLPTGAMRLGRASGILLSSMPFDGVTIAPTGGYADSVAVAVDSGTVAVVRSRPAGCGIAILVPFYGKLEVLRIDSVERRMDFRILVDQNCGYRGLEPGIPRQ